MAGRIEALLQRRRLGLGVETPLHELGRPCGEARGVGQQEHGTRATLTGPRSAGSLVPDGRLGHDLVACDSRGTLVLAGATFASVRSANRAARVAELWLLAGLRPLLLPSRLDDPSQKVGFADNRWLHTPGGGGAAEVGETAVYFALSLRNVGTGIAALHGWRLYPRATLSSGNPDRAPLEEFQRLTRDLYVPAGDAGFWQGTFRDPSAPEFAAAKTAVEARAPITIEILYGDHEGGQRMITRFALTPREDAGWIASAGRHWNIDRPDPR